MTARRLFTAKLAPAALWLAIILTSALALYGTRPRAAADRSASPYKFSAARAMTHLAAIAQHPHPIGSDEAARVREHLVQQLSALGGQVEVEQAIGRARSGRNLHAGIVHNVIATFAGESSSLPLMLVAHYDSVPEGPGAADDGAGVVVILETLRALRAGSPIKNDLVVLFTDGEEARGLLGAQAFAASRPDLAQRIGMMVNLEARGSSGPALMFETSDDNGALIREFARAAPYPMATSLMAAIYKLLPNDTDFTPLKAAGLQGLNFAFIETFQSYHTRLDKIENLDPRSVQHTGENVLGIVRHFGNLTLPLTREADLVYFNLFGTRLLVYPAWLARAVALLAPIVFAIVIFRRRDEVTVARTLAAVGSFFLQLLIIVGVSFGTFAIARLIAGHFLEGDTGSNQLLFGGIMGVALGIGIATQRIFQTRLGAANVGAGQLLALSLLTIALSWLLAGGSYVLQWPLVFGMAGMWLGVSWQEPRRFVCLVPALLILVPLGYMFFTALNFTYAAITADALLLATLLSVATAVFNDFGRLSKRTLISIFVVSALLLGAGVHLSKWSVAHPRADTLIYSVNTDENKAKWLSYDAAPDAWTARALGISVRRASDPAYTVGGIQPVLSTEAAPIALSAPAFNVTSDTTTEGVRTLRLQLASTRGARSLLARLPADVRLVAGGWNGKVESMNEKPASGTPWSFRFFNLPPEGASLELRFAARTPIRIWLADSTPGLPSNPPLPSRPDDTMPAFGSDITLAVRSFEL